MMRVILASLAVVTVVILGWLWHDPLASAAEPRMACGTASWYGPESGSITATGAIFRPDGLTAAMPSRSMLGKTVIVTDQSTGRSVTVLVNDLGPNPKLHRLIDLARGAAVRLGIINRGIVRVCITPVPRS